MMYLRSLIIALAALAAPAAAQAQQSAPAASLPYQDYVLGNADAPVQIIEYASFACPHCGHFHEDVWPTLLIEFVDTGLASFVIRPIITQPEQIAGAGAIMASCAGAARYYDAVDLLFVEQENIFDAIRARSEILPIYNRIAGAVGLSPDDFTTCLRAPEHNQRIAQTLEMAAAHGITGTPQFVINGQLLKMEMLDGEQVPMLDGQPIIVNGDRLSGELDADNFRRIVLHFLNESDSDN